jgi:hypothetical protein
MITLPVCLFLLASRIQAADPDQADIRVAIDRGAAFLKRTQLPEGSWKHDKPVGATALAALALLECDTPTDDPVIKKAAEYLRETSISLRHTYSISLALMFFDRLGDRGDESLIQSLGARLLAGQTAQGGWSYYCPGPDAAELNRLTHAVLRRTTDDSKLPRGATRAAEQVPGFQPALADTPSAMLVNPTGDNSNTQFATLAVWVARRHGIQAEKTLAGVKARFHQSQQADGGWPYVWSGPATRANSTPPMTCAGLLGLAAGHAASQATLRTEREKKKAEAQASEAPELRPLRDTAINGGFAFLGEWIDSKGGTYGWRIGSWQVREMSVHTAGFVNYYLLWSIERVCMIYGRRTIGHCAWYPWGAEILLAAQRPDGSWSATTNGVDGVDTCFALLFLNRSNLAPDLTATLKSRLGVEQAKLTAKGIAAENFKEPTEKDKPVKKPRTGPELIMPGKGSAPTESATTEAGKLSDQVANAGSEEQKSLINKLRDEKGSVHTEALALAIGRLSGPARAQARDALAERLARMSEATLAEKLQDENAEVRRGACLACAMKESKRFIPELVRLLEDPEALVTRAAHAALVPLTGEDFGPAANAGDQERKRALEQWKEKWGQKK